MQFKDLAGKTIESATQMEVPGLDDDGWLLLKFTDGTKVLIVADYGCYTGKSNGEYPTTIYPLFDDELDCSLRKLEPINDLPSRIDGE